MAASNLAQADIHRRTRRAHALEVSEDYVETIADLMEQTGEARVVDIARRLGVTHVTVTRTVSRLRVAGLVIAKPYRSIFLTQGGKSMADRVRKRHEIVVAFLLALGLSNEAAHVDAEGIEHHVSKETLDAFERFVEARRQM
ncbi:MAG: manganese-binding transcriptional regulator MntR [Pyrinomonadaceae bacterium]|nr:manganese-binding transcriptional regulator MntR [Phycisphaerales bacterium]